MLPVLLSLSCLLFGASGFAATSFPALQSAPPLPAGMVWLEDETWGDYNLRAVWTRPDGDNASLLLVLNHAGKLGEYRLHVTPQQTRLERVESGLLLPLAEGDGLPQAAATKLLIKRRGRRVELFADGRSLLVGHDGSFPKGTLGYAVTGGGALSEVRLQPVQSLAFTDDFMRVEGESGDWEVATGLWKTRSLLNPVRSANAFTYAGVAHNEPAVALTGHWFWDDCRFSVSVKSSGVKPFGLVMAWQNARNYLLFEWSARTAGEMGRRQLALVADGQRHVLAESPGGFRANQWYRVAFSCWRGHARVTVDGAPAGAALTPSLPGGKVGLFTRNYQATYFDDAQVESIPAVAGDFADAGDLAARSGGAWEVSGGRWECLAEESGGVCVATPASTARALVGRPEWTDCRTAATVTLGADAIAGLYCRYQDPLNYVSLEWRRGKTLALVHAREGVRKDLATSALPAEGKLTARLSLTMQRGVLTASMDGRELLKAFTDYPHTGRVGLLAQGKAACRFADFQVDLSPAERTPVFTIHEIFEGEVSMANWAAAQSDWRCSQCTLDGQAVTVNWHRAVFWGDTEVEAEPDRSRGIVALGVGADRSALDSGYWLTVSADTATLTRNGRPVNKAALTQPPDATVSLRQAGPVVVAAVGGQPVLTFRDAQPLTGTRVAWYATGGAASAQSIQVFNANVLTDTFQTAPVNWRPAGGWWAVSRRWQCDPRWSFFSGLNEQGASVLWHKRGLRGDQSVEFAAGVKMARQHGDYAAYGRDLNLTLCADGKDLSTGYSFVFAGWGDEKNAIVRGTKVVAESPALKFSYSIHRQWFLLRAEKLGNKLTFYVDDKPVCEYEDPQPLTGDRMALWTYRGGMMVSRFRACAQSVTPFEPVEEAWPTASKTFYDAT